MALAAGCMAACGRSPCAVWGPFVTEYDMKSCTVPGISENINGCRTPPDHPFEVGFFLPESWHRARGRGERCEAATPS